jgi:hypothetical protein
MSNINGGKCAESICDVGYFCTALGVVVYVLPIVADELIIALLKI